MKERRVEGEKGRRGEGEKKQKNKTKFYVSKALL